MQWPFATKRFRIPAIWLQVSAIALLIGAWCSYIWWKNLPQAVGPLAKDQQAVWHDLDSGRIFAGQDVEEVIANTKPSSIDRYGEYVVLTYGEGKASANNGVGIMAKKGRLIRGYTWGSEGLKSFFDNMTDQDWKSYAEAYDNYWKPRRMARDATAAMRHSMWTVAAIVTRR